MKYVILWFRMFFGIHLLFSTLRHYMTDWQAEIPGAGGRFVNSLMEMGLYEMVKGIEGVVGLCLVLNLFVPLVLVVELPISFIIFYLNFIIVGTGYQLFTGPQEIFLNCLLMVFYGGYYVSMLQRSAPPKPLWQHWRGVGAADVPARSATSGEQS
jgi:hypothetical protein